MWTITGTQTKVYVWSLSFFYPDLQKNLKYDNHSTRRNEAAMGCSGMRPTRNTGSIWQVRGFLAFTPNHDTTCDACEK